MDKATHLTTVLLALAAKQNQPFEAAIVTEQLREAAANNGFDASNHVPNWLLFFFDALQDGRQLAKQPIPANEPFTGDVSNFLAELEDIIQFTWRDSGETVELVADKLQLFGIVSNEDATYEVGALPA